MENRRLTGSSQSSPALNGGGSWASGSGALPTPSRLHLQRQNSLTNAAAVHAALEDKHVSTRRQSIAVLNGEVGLRVSKQSSAHRKLHCATQGSQQRDELLARLADIIKLDSSDGESRSTKGKLPIEAAYTVMKRVTEAAKAPILPVGMSTYNKLESLRTDPALKVLQSTTWRDFFSAPHTHTTAQTATGTGTAMTTQGRALHTHTNTATTTTTASTASLLSEINGLEIEEREREGDPMLDVLFDALIDRVELLWRQLKVPRKEQFFFRKSLCQRPIQSMEQSKELASYVERLEEHKMLTKTVLQRIAHRESVIRKFYDVVTALHRKFSSNNNNNNNNHNTFTHTQSLTSLHSTNHSAPQASAGVFWKEELILSLDEVRCATLETIKAIQIWRRAMWRPHAFLYKEVNYLLKMKEDMALLDSDVVIRILESVPLSRDTLQCILFIPLDEYATLLARVSPHPRAVRSMSQRSFSLAALQESDEERGGTGGTTTGAAMMSGEAYIEQLVRDFTTNIDREELRAAAAVVLEEERLQQALHTEHAALKSKGVFIPLLRPASNQTAPPPFTRAGSSSSLHNGNANGNNNTSSATGNRPMSANLSGKHRSSNSGKMSGSLSPEKDRPTANFMPFSGT